MPRAATTFDIFNAVAEPKRRAVLSMLAGKQLCVNTIVERLQWTQSQTSKHLGVLKQVGLVEVKREGRKQLYSVNADALRPIHEWVQTFEKFWTDHLFAIKEVAEKRMKHKK